MKYINECDICATNLPKMAKYPQKYLEIPQVPVAVLAVDTIGHLPAPSIRYRWASTVICMCMSYVFVVPMKEKSAENVVEVYLSGMFSHKDSSIAILSHNGTELKNTVLDDACEQFDIKRLLSCLFHTQGNLRTENVHNFLKRTLNIFLVSSDLEWDELLLFECYCYNIFPSCNGTKPPFSSCLAVNKQEAN